MNNNFADKVIERYGKEYFDLIWNEENVIDPYATSWKANKEVVLNCLNNSEHHFHRMMYVFWDTQKCPICEKQKNSISIKYPESNRYWSDLNDKTPLDYSSASSDTVYWKCNNNIHNDYQRTIKNSVISKFECPLCRSPKKRGTSKKRNDLVGNVYGDLMVISYSETICGNAYWNCICSCGAKVAKNGSDMKSGKIKTCGNKSYHNTGENNPNWKDGATEKNYSDRYTQEYLNWHCNILKKDNYTCQCCGQYSGDLEVHHIRDFATYKELRTNVSNGLVLCRNCHNPTVPGSFHNMYGTIGKSPEELEEYINSKRKSLGIDIPFTIASYLSGNILHPGDISFEIDPPWIFDTIRKCKLENNYSLIAIYNRQTKP